MPNLRRNSTVVTYNDDAIYKAMVKQRKSKPPLKLPNIQPPPLEQNDNNIPDVVYSQDGRRFFPCLYCCHAFAIKADQLQHMQQCNFKTVSQVPDLIVQPKLALNKSSNNVLAISKPKQVQNVMNVNGKFKPFQNGLNNYTSPFKNNPKEKVQKAMTIDSLIQNKALTVIKKVPSKIGFPKIKFKFPPKNLNTQIKSEVIKVECEVNEEVDANEQLSESSMSTDSYDQKTPKLYFTKDELKQYHELYRHSDKSKCTICFKAIAKTCWYRHLKTHCIEKQYSCGSCDKKFGRKDHRDIHERTHAPQIQIEDHFLSGLL